MIEMALIANRAAYDSILSQIAVKANSIETQVSSSSAGRYCRDSGGVVARAAIFLFLKRAWAEA